MIAAFSARIFEPHRSTGGSSLRRRRISRRSFLMSNCLVMPARDIGREGVVGGRSVHMGVFKFAGDMSKE